jgi:hypothetical protein
MKIAVRPAIINTEIIPVSAFNSKQIVRFASFLNRQRELVADTIDPYVPVFLMISDIAAIGELLQVIFIISFAFSSMIPGI